MTRDKRLFVDASICLGGLAGVCAGSVFGARSCYLLFGGLLLVTLARIIVWACEPLRRGK